MFCLLFFLFSVIVGTLCYFLVFFVLLKCITFYIFFVLWVNIVAIRSRDTIITVWYSWYIFFLIPVLITNLGLIYHFDLCGLLSFKLRLCCWAQALLFNVFWSHILHFKSATGQLSFGGIWLKSIFFVVEINTQMWLAGRKSCCNPSDVSAWVYKWVKP